MACPRPSQLIGIATSSLGSFVSYQLAYRDNVGIQVMMAATKPPLQRWRVVGCNTGINEGTTRRPPSMLILQLREDSAG